MDSISAHSDLSYEAQHQRGNRRRMIGIVLLALGILAAAWYFMAGGNAPADETATGSPTAAGAPQPAGQEAVVTVISPGVEQAEQLVTATGTIAARREMPVGVVGEGGQVLRVLVEPGQWVRAGETLAVIDRSVQSQQLVSLDAQVRVARADADLTQAELTRAETLVERGFVSKADIDRRIAQRDAAAARVRVAQAQLAEARARTGRLDIRAPAAGLVLTRQIEPGQVVGGGSGVLFRLASGGLMELQARVSEGDLNAFTVGARAKVTPVGSDTSFAGQVWQMAPVIDAQSRQGTARIALGYSPALRPGGFAAAEIMASSRPGVVLPQSAVQSDDKGSYVFVVGKGDKIERRDITIGSVLDRGIVIRDGLTGKERIVQSAAPFLAPGQKVKPSKTAAPAA